MRAAERMYAI